MTRLFEKYGEVEKCQIMKDPHTKESRGFGFVKMVTSDQADAAKDGLQGEVIEGRTLSIEKARRARPRTPTPGKYFGPPKRGKSEHLLCRGKTLLTSVFYQRAVAVVVASKNDAVVAAMVAAMVVVRTLTATEVTTVSVTTTVVIAAVATAMTVAAMTAAIVTIVPATAAVERTVAMTVVTSAAIGKRAATPTLEEAVLIVMAAAVAAAKSAVTVATVATDMIDAVAVAATTVSATTVMVPDLASRLPLATASLQRVPSRATLTEVRPKSTNSQTRLGSRRC